MGSHASSSSPAPAPLPSHSLTHNHHVIPRCLRRKLIDWIRRKNPDRDFPDDIDDDELKIVVIVSKLRIHPAYRNRAEITEDMMETSAEILSNFEDMREDYLQLEFHNGLKLVPSVMPSGEKPRSQNEVLQVKLIISDHATRRQNTARAILSPVLRALGMLGPMGLFDMSLWIGPWILEWNASSLCLPRKAESGAVALVVVDVATIVGESEVSRALDSLSKVLVRWNTLKIYRPLLGREKASEPQFGGNHGFITDVLRSVFPFILPISYFRALGLDLNLRLGLTGEFLHRLAKTGSTKLEYRPSAQALTVSTELGTDPFVFNSHRELDLFMHSLYELVPNFNLRFRRDYALLKSFDRALWMIFWKQRSRGLDSDALELTAPHSATAGDGGLNMCPFGTPHAMGDFVEDLIYFPQEDEKHDFGMEDERLWFLLLHQEYAVFLVISMPEARLLIPNVLLA